MDRRSFVRVAGAAMIAGVTTNEYNNKVNSIEDYINKTFPVISLDSRLQNKISVVEKDSNVGLKGPTSASGTIKLKAKNDDVGRLRFNSTFVFIEQEENISGNLEPKNIEKYGKLINYGSHMHDYTVENPQMIRINHSELYQEPNVLLGIKLH